MPDNNSTTRRKIFRLACYNAGLWALGSGLVSSTLITYWIADILPHDYPHRALAISFALASPRFFGVLSLFAPALIHRIRSRRRFCLLAYSACAVTLLFIPVLGAPGRLPSKGATLGAVISLWGLYHLLEYLGTISLWSWFGDLVPSEIRGRFIGRRQRWLLVGQIVGTLASAGFLFLWNRYLPQNDSRSWIGYAVSATAGAVVLLLAVVPMARIPSIALQERLPRGQLLRAIRSALDDRSYRRFVLYNCWSSTVNGLTGTAQFLYQKDVLGFAYSELLLLRTAMQTGQSLVSPPLGKLIDRIGNRSVLVVSQLAVAAALLFFVLASEQTRWIAAGAYLVWIAYAGLNVGLPKLMLDLAPREENSGHISLYYALGGLFNGIGIVVGGLILDALGLFNLNDLTLRETYLKCGTVFIVAILARSLSAWLLARVFRGQDEGAAN